MHKDIHTKREREKGVVSEMIALYCRKQHGRRNGLCPECEALAAYARKRSDKCPFMETKTFCSNCKVHCYKPEMREKIRAVMRFSGPRMIFCHPVTAVRHVLEILQNRIVVSFIGKLRHILCVQIALLFITGIFLDFAL